MGSSHRVLCTNSIADLCLHHLYRNLTEDKSGTEDRTAGMEGRIAERQIERETRFDVEIDLEGILLTTLEITIGGAQELVVLYKGVEGHRGSDVADNIAEYDAHFAHALATKIFDAAEYLFSVVVYHI